jgi:hypothetical protein
MPEPDPTLPPNDPDPEPLNPVFPGPGPEEPGPDVLPEVDPDRFEPQQI